MESQILSRPLSLAAGLAVLSLTSMPVAAQTSANAVSPPATDQTAAPGQPPPVQLARGVLLDVLNLSRAHVGDGTIIAFVQGSGTVYGLGADEIVYLRQQGVSDSVLAALVNQRQKATNPATQVAQLSGYPAASISQPESAYTQPQPTYAQPQVEYVPASTVYVAPSAPVYLDASYPYYGGYYGYYYPSVSYSIGVVGYGGWGGRYRGGYHPVGRVGGGGFHGGSYHPGVPAARGGYHSGQRR